MRKGTHVRPHRRSNRKKSWKAGRSRIDYSPYTQGINLLHHTQEKVIGGKYIVLLTYEVETYGTYGRINILGGEIAVFKKGVEKGLIYREDYKSRQSVDTVYRRLNSIRQVEKWTTKGLHKPLLHPHLSKTKDSDHDGVPDAYDCQPHNPKKQDGVVSEHINQNKSRIWGYFKLSDGSKTKFEMRKGESWFQWGNTNDKLGLTVDRVEQLCNEWLENN